MIFPVTRNQETTFLEVEVPYERPADYPEEAWLKDTARIAAYCLAAQGHVKDVYHALDPHTSKRLASVSYQEIVDHTLSFHHHPEALREAAAGTFILRGFPAAWVERIVGTGL